MKKLLAILLVLCMVIPAAALGEEVVKIGVYEPATGDSGAGGKQEMLGMQYANALFPTVKMGDTEYKVELVYACLLYTSGSWERRDYQICYWHRAHEPEQQRSVCRFAL